jgi:hypothetical protein
MISDTQTELQSLLEQGRVAAEAGDTLAARNAFRRAAELAPECAEAWRGLGASATVLSERRTYLARASELDPACAESRRGLAEIDAWLTQGRLIAPAPRRAELLPAALPPSLSAVVTNVPALAPGRMLSLVGAGLLCLLTMTMLTTVGALIFTSMLGYFMAFILGPLVGELMLRLADAMGRAQRGQLAQIILGAAVGVGGLLALALGGSLLPAIGLPLTADTIAMARSMGAADASTALLFHPAMAVFVGAAVAGTVYRLKK